MNLDRPDPANHTRGGRAVCPPKGHSVAPSARAPSLVLGLMAAPAWGLDASSQAQVLKDQVAIVVFDLVSEDIVRRCTQADAAVGAAMRNSLADWRRTYRIAEVDAALDAGGRVTSAQARQAAAAQVGPMTDQVIAKSRQGDEPLAATCARHRDLWHEPGLNPWVNQPAAYDEQHRVRSLAAATQNAGGPAAGTGAPAAAASPGASSAMTVGAPPGTGTVYTPAQLKVLVKSWWGPQHKLEAARAAQARMGRFVVKGTGGPNADHTTYWLDNVDGPFVSSWRVLPGVDVKAFLGREVLVEGELDEVPSGVVMLRHARLVAPGPGLHDSDLPSREGMYRRTVDVATIRTAPGQGIAPKDLEVVLDVVDLTNGEDTIVVLLRDGTAYRRSDLPPEDLNVEVSRRTEPQHWARWRRAGSGYEWQVQDDDGKPTGDWKKLSGIRVEPWRPGQSIDGSFVHQSFYGNAGIGGGTSFRQSYSFAATGTFTRNFSSMSLSGTLATATLGVQSGGYAQSGASGSESGGFGTAPGVAVSTGTKRRDDGARNRGRYRAAGYALELSFDDGSVERVFSFPSGTRAQNVFIGDSTYLPPSK